MSKRRTPNRIGSERAVIYTRVSTEAQGDGYSLPTQLEGCLKYAAERGYIVLREFEDQHTGLELDRPGLNDLLSHVRSLSIDVIVVYAIDRLSRMVANQAILEMEFSQLGARVEYVLGGYDDSPEGEMMRVISSALAQFENRQRMERSMRGRKGKALAGYVVISNLRTPYGYDLVSEPHKAWLVVNEVEAPIVRQMYDWALSGMSLNKIAQALSEKGVLTRGDQRPNLHKRTGKGIWHGGTVRNILANPVYKGEWVYNKVRTSRLTGTITRTPTPLEERIVVPVPAIVDAATWETVQAQLERNRLYSKRNAKRDYLLRGLIRCTCGCMWQGHYVVSRDNGYYRCSNTLRSNWVQRCTMPGSVRQDRLEEAVWTAVVAKLLDPDHLRTELAEQRAAALAAHAIHEQRLTAIATAIADIRRKLGMLLDQVLVGGFAKEIIEGRKQMLLRNLEDLQVEEARINARLQSASLDEQQEQSVLDFAAQVRNGLQTITPTVKRQVLELLQVRVDALSQTEFQLSALIPISTTLNLPHLKRNPRRTGSALQKDNDPIARGLACQTNHNQHLITILVPLLIPLLPRARRRQFRTDPASS